MKNQKGNNMDLLKKFRYNFHYWLKNCYQPESTVTNEDHNKEIYQTTNATNEVANQIYQMAKIANASGQMPGMRSPVSPNLQSPQSQNGKGQNGNNIGISMDQYMIQNNFSKFQSNVASDMKFTIDEIHNTLNQSSNRNLMSKSENRGTAHGRVECCINCQAPNHNYQYELFCPDCIQHKKGQKSEL